MFLRVAWRNLWRNRRRTVITSSAIGLGLGLFLVMEAYIGGFYEHALEAATRSYLGQAQIHSSSYRQTQDPEKTIPRPKNVMGAARRLGAVVAASPRVFGIGLAAMGDRSEGVRLMGVDLEAEKRVTNFFQDIVKGSWPASEREVLIGFKLAEDLELDAGAKMVLTAADVRTGELTSQLVVISGLLRTNNAFLDRQAIVTPLALTQRLTGLKDQIHEVALRLSVDAVDRELIEASLAPLRADDLEISPWQALNPALAASLEINDTVMVIAVLVVFFIIALGIVNTLTMSFLERFREFGILRAVGTSPRRLASLILYEAMLLGVVGVCMGVVLGLAIYWPLSIYGVNIGDIEMAGISFNTDIRFRLATANLIRLPVMFLILTTLTGVGTARRAARIVPIEALRYF